MIVVRALAFLCTVTCICEKSGAGSEVLLNIFNDFKM